MVSPAWCFQIDRFLQKKMGPDWPFFEIFLFFRKKLSLNIIQSMKSSLFIFFAWKLTKHAVFHHFHTRILFIPYYKKVCIRPENELLCWTWVKNESRVIKTSFLSLIHVIVSVYRGGGNMAPSHILTISFHNRSVLADQWYFFLQFCS